MPVVQTSRLLNLPKELRDVIFEYALSEPQVLLVCNVDVDEVDSKIALCARNDEDNETRESNQLRYVCRQLHSETRALGLRYNDLEFPSMSDENGMNAQDLFTLFYQDCPPTHLARIQRITLLDDETRLLKEKIVLSELVSPSILQFCQHYAHSKVIVRFLWATDDPVELLMALSQNLGLGNLFPAEIGSEDSWFHSPFGECFQGIRRPVNLRFSCSHEFKEGTVRRNAIKVIERQHYFDDRFDLDAEVDVWCGIARRLHEEGI